MAAVLFVLVLVLAASGGAAGDDDARLPQLKLRDMSLNGCGSFAGLLNATASASDISEQRVVVGGGEGLTVFCPDEAWQGLTDLMSRSGCGSFAGLLSATASAGEVFHERLVGGGLTVFCPDDKAVAAFAPTSRRLAAAHRAAVLLHHGVPGCYGREQFKAFNWVSVSTLAPDAATNRSHAMTVRDDGSALGLWSWPYQDGATLVTKTVSEEAPLALYVVHAVLLPRTVACAGYLGWLRCWMLVDVPLWGALLWVVAALVGAVIGCLIPVD
jgi:hypothetical protein